MGGDRWGCASAPPPAVVVVVVLVQGFRGEVLLKDCSVRHATSLSPIQSLPGKEKYTGMISERIHSLNLIDRNNFYFRTLVNSKGQRFRNIIPI